MKTWISAVVMMVFLTPVARAAETKSSFWMTATGTHVRTQIATTGSQKIDLSTQSLLKRYAPVIQMVLGTSVRVRHSSSGVSVSNPRGDRFEFRISRDISGLKIDSHLKTRNRLGAEALMGITRHMRVNNEALVHVGLGTGGESGNS